MAQNTKQPRNVIEQIVFGQEITNDNVVTLSENVAIVNEKLDRLLIALAIPLSEPTALGAETNQEGGQ